MGLVDGAGGWGWRMGERGAGAWRRVAIIENEREEPLACRRRHKLPVLVALEGSDCEIALPDPTRDAPTDDARAHAHVRSDRRALPRALPRAQTRNAAAMRRRVCVCASVCRESIHEWQPGGSLRGAGVVPMLTRLLLSDRLRLPPPTLPHLDPPPKNPHRPAAPHLPLSLAPSYTSCTASPHLTRESALFVACFVPRTSEKGRLLRMHCVCAKLNSSLAMLLERTIIVSTRAVAPLPHRRPFLREARVTRSSFSFQDSGKCTCTS
jgi:hypothetical protein